MSGQLVGLVEALWRYPVKSMLGESLQQVPVTERGLCGDRAYALWDHATDRVASAKNPRLWRGLLGCRARFEAMPLPEAPPPPVRIEAAGSEAILSSDPAINTTLSGWFDRRVSLLDRPPEGASLDQYWPPIEQRAFQDVVNELVMPAGTFFDSSPIHAISTASLERLRQLEPQLDFAVERFRPNLLIAAAGGASGFVEEGWIGRRLRLGASLELKVEQGCPRCVVTTLAQGAIPEQIEILRATARHNRVVAGVLLSVLQPGAVAVGDAVTLLE
ncbi:MOSC domain-containing protein [Synechococcus sp. CS-1325]|uniref:MOSC domain-containing protein n=1 Tax=unclassified Synechococcus TaxID=2626047 RepID=UPI000DB6A7D4|nr:MULTISPECIES: MOSC domain-containing protein [unclassified Synechococcus]MCT0199531.1 MOSC domain-containing protein [Synechococcus sp. CS-1325]MCT0231209.1 MOSC domain-containing protein [Synechococcus sp. CS-1324]PZV00978.1 MAG: MOSC domain-containing protein [Cyanobium sp.]PZV01964.1 MAG: MOSC domain-containing protein [Cyanobium sp.]